MINCMDCFVTCKASRPYITRCQARLFQVSATNNRGDNFAAPFVLKGFGSLHVLCNNHIEVV
jgi:hypothetical protein